MNSKNYRNTMQFAVQVNKNGIVEVGKSAILQPKLILKVEVLSGLMIVNCYVEVV